MSRTERHESTRRRPRRQTRGLTSWTTPDAARHSSRDGRSSLAWRWYSRRPAGWPRSLAYSGIVVFGTSLSDPGNALPSSATRALRRTSLLNPLLIPSAPYTKGGHHFSNGATWIEQYARSVGLGDSVRPALATTDPAVTNYAVGAARAYNDGINFNLTRQVDTFLLRSGGVASSQALYVIEMGSNDIRDAFSSMPAAATAVPFWRRHSGRSSPISSACIWLGARNFLVWAAPNVALTPAIRTLGPGAGALATTLTQASMATSPGCWRSCRRGCPESVFTRLAANQILDAIVANPAAFNLTTVTTACVTPSVAPFSCQQADEFLFWDGIHPTRAGHAILAEQTSRLLP